MTRVFSTQLHVRGAETREKRGKHEKKGANTWKKGAKRVKKGANTRKKGPKRSKTPEMGKRVNVPLKWGPLTTEVCGEWFWIKVFSLANVSDVYQSSHVISGPYVFVHHDIFGVFQTRLNCSEMLSDRVICAFPLKMNHSVCNQKHVLAICAHFAFDSNHVIVKICVDEQGRRKCEGFCAISDGVGNGWNT